MKKQLLIVMLLCESVVALAQSDSTLSKLGLFDIEKVIAKRSYFRAAFRYASNYVVDGREYGVTEFLLSPSFYYYHKSGLFAGVSGTVLQKADPAYANTSLKLGYNGNLSEKLSYQLAYGRTFTNPDTAGILANNLSASIDLLDKWFGAGIYGSYAFGDETAYSLTPNVSATVSKYFQRGLVRSVSFGPTVEMVFGTANLPFTTLPTTVFTKGEGESWTQLRQSLIARRTTRAAASASDAYSYTFGLMNVGITLPVGIGFGKTRLTLSYVYNLPRKLSEEENLDISPSGYVSASISVRL